MDYDARQIREKTGYSPRTVNNWIRRGVLPKVAFRGAKTSYGDEHFVGLLAIRALSADGLGIVGIRSFFKKATPADIRRAAGVAAAAAPTASAAPPAAASVAHWTHVTLAPGVMLLVRDDASDAATKVAAAFQSAFAASK